VGYSEYVGGFPASADVQKEIVKRNPPFQTKKGWWYVSETRFHRKNKLWDGPFKTEQEALTHQDQFE
jgi:hypothetical protein